MRKSSKISKIRFTGGVFVLLMSMVLYAESSFSADDSIWHIKCFGADGHTINVKSFGTDGHTYAVKAMKRKNSDLLDIKALTGKRSKHHVKILKGEKDGMAHVKAVKGSEVLNIKGIDRHGMIYDVKAFPGKRGEYDIKCVDHSGKKFGLKAISPDGEVYDVKGMKSVPGEEELEIGIAHVKARKRR